jgi:hypothetical protein
MVRFRLLENGSRQPGPQSRARPRKRESLQDSAESHAFRLVQLERDRQHTAIMQLLDANPEFRCLFAGVLPSTPRPMLVVNNATQTNVERRDRYHPRAD